MKWLTCWRRGHKIVESIDFHPTCPKHFYHCDRCKRVLPGPGL